MGRLIDADKLINKFVFHTNLDSETKELIEDIINETTPVDAVPVVHGRWETVEDWDGDEHYQCSVCGAEFVLIEGDPDDNDYLYCPHCGADMRKDDGDE